MGDEPKQKCQEFKTNLNNERTKEVIDLLSSLLILR